MAQELNPEDFMSRADKIEQYEFEKSDESKIIILPNKEGLGFRYNCYMSIYLDDKIPKMEFDNVIAKANKICESVWLKRKLEEEAEYSSYLKYILYIAIFFSILSFLLLIILVYGEGANDLLYASIFLIVIASVLTIIVVVKSVTTVPDFIDLEAAVMMQLSEYFDNINKEYEKKHLQWEVGEKFFFLKLKILEN